MTLNVTHTYLPPLEEYVHLLEGIWERNQVTNNGPLVQELEERLKEYLGVKHLYFVTNGTVALQIAIKSLSLVGEIITTPFSYVATTSSIVWEGCTPVFVDIEPGTLSIDPAQIESVITPRTTAILATHVYGYPGDVDGIEMVARRHGLKVIYDAAHAFGVTRNDQSILQHGDVSVLSFHATKLFHTIEGGALITNDDGLAHRIAYMRNFGHNGAQAFWGLGINGKNSEMHAAMGLCVLPHVSSLMQQRRRISEHYDSLLDGLGLLLERPRLDPAVRYNYGYYPVFFASEAALLRVVRSLNEQAIFPRRYFYPPLNSLNYVTHTHMPVAENIAARVLCLPLSHDTTPDDVEKVAATLRRTLQEIPHV